MDENERKKILDAMAIYNKYKDNEIINAYTDALHTLIMKKENDHKEHKGTLYKSSKKYDYYIIESYETIDTDRSGNYHFVESGFDGYGTNKNGGMLSFCRRFNSIEDVKKRIDERVIEDNLEGEE